MSPLRIALYQAQSGIDPRSNAALLDGAVRQAAAGGAAMLFTPEMSGMLDRDRERALGKVRIEPEDEVLATLRESAARENIWIHLGSLSLKGESGKLVNRGFVIDDRGEIRARYDKIHLFDVDLPTGESWRESSTYEAGNNTVIVADTPVGRLGMTICYDLRFPALFERLSEAGADLISVPAAFTVPTGKAHWDVLLRARAIEAELFVVAAAQAGQHQDGRATYGHSLVVDPWGEKLLEMGDGPGLDFCEINLDRIAEVRARIPVHQHRRPIAPVTN